VDVDRWPSFQPERWLDDSANRARLVRFGLVAGEYLMVASNMLDLRGHPRGVELWRGRVEDLAALVTLLTVPPYEDPGVDVLVARGVDRSFVVQWAVDDDEVRPELISTASDERLAEMLVEMARAWPRLAPLVVGTERASPGADIAEKLVEAAEEIQIELDRRREGA
jgi:hypothetical protein